MSNGRDGDGANVFDVIVVGAGVAGLQAARDIVDQKTAVESEGDREALKVVVIESSDYVGGRCKMETLNGITVPTGATFLHGHHNNPIYDVGVDEGWHFEFLEWPDCYYIEGSSSGQTPSKNPRRLMKALESNRDDPEVKELFDILDDMSEVDLGKLSTQLGKPKHEITLRDYLGKCCGVSARAIGIAEQVVANDMCSKLDEIGMCEMYAESQYWNHGELYAMIDHTGGFQKYIDYLAYGPKDVRDRHRVDLSKSESALDIRLNTRVTSVEYESSRPIADKRRVCVTTEDGSKFYASHAILTPSLPVLVKNIRISPPLFDCDSDTTRRQVDMFHNATKVFLVFSERFWPAECWNVVAAGNLIPEFGFHPAQRQKPESGDTEAVYLAAAFIAGENAKALEHMPDQDIVGQFLKELEEVCATESKGQTPASACFTGEYLLRSWKDNPHTLGAYSAPSLGSEQWRTSVLRQAGSTNGCTYLAGEAWNLGFNTCVQGAAKTGADAARSLCELRQHAR